MNLTKFLFVLHRGFMVHRVVLRKKRYIALQHLIVVVSTHVYCLQAFFYGMAERCCAPIAQTHNNERMTWTTAELPHHILATCPAI